MHAAIVLAAIGLDDQAFCEADEIRDERADRLLALELEALQSLAAQHPPQPALGVGGLLPHGLREGEEAFLARAVRPSPSPSPARGEGGMGVSAFG